MATVVELIEYLQKLPPETDVQVAVGVDESYYSAYTTFEALQVPQGFDLSSRYHFSDNDTIEYRSLGDEPTLWIGRT